MLSLTVSETSTETTLLFTLPFLAVPVIESPQSRHSVMLPTDKGKNDRNLPMAYDLLKEM